MKYLLSILCLFLFSCQQEVKTFVVHGSVADNAYENEIVYLVPLEGATVDNVDSTFIKNGVFRFTGKVDSAQIYIIRTRPVLRLKLQELLVVVEQGEIDVVLDSVSWAGGTEQNKALQEWKDMKTQVERRIYRLMSQQKAETDTTSLDNKISILRKEFSEYNYSFVKANETNEVGRFVFELTRSSFSQEQLEDMERH